MTRTTAITSTFWERVLYLGVFPLGHCAVDWGTGGIWILAPAIAAALDLSPSQVGILFSVRMGLSALAYLPAGLVGHNIRNRGLFLMSTFWWVALAYMAASVAPGYWFLVVLLALASAGAAAWHPVAMGIMVEQMPARRGFIIAMHGVGGTLSGVLAPLTVGLLLAYTDWSRVLQVSALPAVLVGVLFLRVGWMVPKTSGRSLRRSGARKILKVLGLPISLGALALLCLHGMSSTALHSMTPLYLIETHGMSSRFAGTAFAAMVLAGAIAGPLVGIISDRFGRKPVALLTLLGGSAAALLLSMASDAPGLLSSMIVAGMLQLAVRAVLMATALEVVGSPEMAVLGLLFLVSSGGEALGALLGGLMGDVNLRYSLALASALALAAGAIAAVHPFAPAGSGGRISDGDGETSAIC